VQAAPLPEVGIRPAPLLRRWRLPVEKQAMRALVQRSADAAALALALMLAACTSTEVSQPVGLELNQPVHTEPVRAWRLVASETTLGYVVQFAPEDGEIERQFFSVRNPWQQELGTVDRLGRAWRFVPHSSDPEWLSTGTLLAGVQAILSAPSEAALEELPLSVLGGGAAPAQAPAQGR
jgi:hypothetical protein